MTAAEQARLLYQSRLGAELEPSHRGQYVAIEPVSQAFFLDERFIDAALAAKNAFPHRKTFVLRIGHDAAFHIGGVMS